MGIHDILSQIKVKGFDTLPSQYESKRMSIMMAVFRVGIFVAATVFGLGAASAFQGQSGAGVGKLVDYRPVYANDMEEGDVLELMRDFQYDAKIATDSGNIWTRITVPAGLGKINGSGMNMRFQSLSNGQSFSLGPYRNSVLFRAPVYEKSCKLQRLNVNETASNLGFGYGPEQRRPQDLDVQDVVTIREEMIAYSRPQRSHKYVYFERQSIPSASRGVVQSVNTYEVWVNFNTHNNCGSVGFSNPALSYGVSGLLNGNKLIPVYQQQENVH